jgi:hypothetical protein
MYNTDLEHIKRVYISKIYVSDDGEVSYITNVPLGKEYVMEGITIVPNKRYIFSNPYYYHIEVIPEIRINDQWYDPYWNDQIGVRASYSYSELDNIVIQTGKLGLAMIPSSSGNGFNSLTETYTGSAKLRLIIRSKR